MTAAPHTLEPCPSIGQMQLLREMVDADIRRTSETESFMVRAGLLRDILDFAISRASTAPKTGDVERVERAIALTLFDMGAPLLAPEEVGAAAQAAISAMPDNKLVSNTEVVGWQPIEAAPKDGTTVWIGNPSSVCPAYFYLDAWRNWFKGPRFENARQGGNAFAPEEVWFEPTHWQPVPRPPAAIAKVS